MSGRILGSVDAAEKAEKSDREAQSRCARGASSPYLNRRGKEARRRGGKRLQPADRPPPALTEPKSKAKARVAAILSSLRLLCRSFGAAAAELLSWKQMRCLCATLSLSLSLAFPSAHGAPIVLSKHTHTHTHAQPPLAIASPNSIANHTCNIVQRSLHSPMSF